MCMFLNEGTCQTRKTSTPHVRVRWKTLKGHVTCCVGSTNIRNEESGERGHSAAHHLSEWHRVQCVCYTSNISSIEAPEYPNQNVSGDNKNRCNRRRFRRIKLEVNCHCALRWTYHCINSVTVKTRTLKCLKLGRMSYSMPIYGIHLC